MPQSVSHTDSPTIPTSLLTPVAINQYTTTTPTTLPSPKIHSDQTTQNIIFGVFAVVLAFAALVIGCLQLRSYKRLADEEDRGPDGQTFELIETRCAYNRQSQS